MKGFWVGVAVTLLIIVAFPPLGRWIIATPYRTLAAYGQTAVDVPTARQGGGRGGRMTSGCPRALSAGYAD